MTESGLGPLSHSSANTLLSCEQKFYYYKVENRDPDPDYSKSDALAVGSAAHKLLEDSLHEKPDKIRERLAACATDPDIMLAESDFNLVHAMVLKYVRLHKRMGFKVIAVEIEVKTDWFLGYIDAIMEDPEGKWWIVDLKFLKTLYMNSVGGLIRDPQLTLYAGHAALIAKQLDLDVKKFGGCRWRVTTKTTAVQKAGEDDVTYVKRILESNIKSYDIAVPVELLDTETRLDIHQKLYKRSQALAKGRVKPVRNYGSCMAYFSPCQYYSACHGGKCHSDLIGGLAITEEK